VSNIRLTDLLKSKKVGDSWYSFEAPEQFHFWTLRHPWPLGCFRPYAVGLLAVRVTAIGSGGEATKQAYTRKSPLRLLCRVEVYAGYYKVIQTKACSFTFRVGDTDELEDALKELSEKTGLNTWQIEKMLILGKRGAEIEFRRHDPDSNGTALYLYRMVKDGDSRLYPDITLHEQEREVGKFRSRLAHCTAKKIETQVYSCALTNKVKPSQIKVRKKAS